MIHDAFDIGDKKSFEKQVLSNDIAQFESGVVHQVYSTFALGRDAEWTCRQFVLEMKQDDEEGIGTFLTIQHESPALIGSTVSFEAELISVDKNEVVCEYQAKVGDRLVAYGRQGQKIVKKEKLDMIFKTAQDA